MNMNNKFIYGYWNTYYKTKNSDSWIPLTKKSKYWYADPMLFTSNGKLYLFTEAFNMKKQIGEIAVSLFENGYFSEPCVIISNQYHMSYPCTFSYAGNIYMIPETSQNGTLEIYTTNGEMCSPWKKIGVLINEIKLVDTTVLYFNNSFYLFGYTENKNQYETRVYYLDMDNLKVTFLKSNISNSNIERPAGNFICISDCYYRPLQYNKNCYGESMRILSSNNPFDIDSYICEREIKIQNVNNLSSIGLRTHTLAYNEEVTVLDIYQSKYDFRTPLWNGIRRLRNARYKIKRGEKLL